MKTQRMLFMTLGIAFLMFVVTPIASAQNIPGFVVWNGTLLKLNTNLKGYYYSPTTVTNLNEFDSKINDNEIQWGIVTGDDKGIFQIAIFSKGQNNACVPEMVLPLQYLAGSQLEFVANFVIDDVDIYASGLVYIKAQLDKTGVTIKPGGTVTTMSAYTVERGFAVPLDLAANGLTIKGTVVKKLGCTPGP
jgi:hypothetical protein